MSLGLGCGSPTLPPTTVAPPASESSTCPLSPGYAQLSVDVAGTTRTVLARLGGVAGSRPPLVLAWHGFGSSAANTMGALRPEVAFDDALVIAPTGLGRTFAKFGDSERPGWQVTSGELGDRDLALFDAILTQLASCYDAERVYSTGFSNGGHFSHLLGCARADKVTAIAPVGGSLKQEAGCAGPVPTLIVHGTADRVVPFSLAEDSLRSWKERNRCDPAPVRQGDRCQQYTCKEDLRMCPFDGAHTWPGWATEEVRAFFAAHPSKKAESSP